MTLIITQAPYYNTHEVHKPVNEEWWKRRKVIDKDEFLLKDLKMIKENLKKKKEIVKKEKMVKINSSFSRSKIRRSSI